MSGISLSYAALLIAGFVVVAGFGLGAFLNASQTEKCKTIGYNYGYVWPDTQAMSLRGSCVRLIVSPWDNR